MKMLDDKKKKHLAYILALSVLILSGLVLFRLTRLNDQLKSKIPYLLPNEKISYFTLLDKDAQRVDISALSGPKPSVIIIFSRPCSKCDESIYFWKRIAEMGEGKINVYGIILDSFSAAFDFEAKAGLNFKIYVPEDIPKFQVSLRVILNLSMTMVYRDGLKYLYLGDLDTENATELVNTLRREIKNNKERPS